MTLLVHKSDLMTVRQHPQLSGKAEGALPFWKVSLPYYLATQQMVLSHGLMADGPKRNLIRVRNYSLSIHIVYGYTYTYTYTYMSLA